MSEDTPLEIYAVMNRLVVPYGANLELTAKCNLDCIHCYHVTCSGPEMSTDEVRALLDDLARLGGMELTLTGGEPLIRSDFTEIITYAVRTAGFSVKVFSNLTLLTEVIADVLASLTLNTVETTILGPDSLTHDGLTGHEGSFESLLRGIDMLNERSVPVSAKTVLMKPNRNKLGKMYDLAYGLNIPFRHDDTVFIQSDGGRKPLSLQIPETEIKRLRNIAGTGQDVAPGLCNMARSVISIGPDGAVYPCGAFPEAAGNVRDTPLAQIWGDAPLMKRVRSLRDEDYRVCRDCVYLTRCSGCVAMGMGLSSGRKYRCRLARKRLRHLS